MHALSNPKEITPTAALRAAKRGRKADASRPVQPEFAGIKALGKRSEKPQIQISTVITRWIIPDATCVVVLAATFPYASRVNTLCCVYISALSGSTHVCRVIILLELSEVPLIELVARSVRIQLALRAWCSLVGRRCRPQLGIAFRQ